MNSLDAHCVFQKSSSLEIIGAYHFFNVKGGKHILLLNSICALFELYDMVPLSPERMLCLCVCVCV